MDHRNDRVNVWEYSKSGIASYLSLQDSRDTLLSHCSRSLVLELSLHVLYRFHFTFVIISHDRPHQHDEFSDPFDRFGLTLALCGTRSLVQWMLASCHHCNFSTLLFTHCHTNLVGPTEEALAVQLDQTFAQSTFPPWVLQVIRVWFQHLPQAYPHEQERRPVHIPWWV